MNVSSRSLKTGKCWQYSVILLQYFAFSAWTLLVGRQEEYPFWKELSDDVLEWCCLKQGANSWCHYHSIISCFIEVQTGFTFLVPAYTACPGRGRYTARVSVCLLTVVLIHIICNCHGMGLVTDSLLILLSCSDLGQITHSVIWY